jgi:two-component system cell cycle response regulator
MGEFANSSENVAAPNATCATALVSPLVTPLNVNECDPRIGDSAAEDLKILLVDDDRASLKLTSRLLERDGYCVTTAYNGQQAHDLILKTQPDLVLCDWEMPEMNGPELCREIRKNAPSASIYFIFVTARNGVNDVLEGFASGADDFLTKPINRGELLARVTAAARRLEIERKLRVASQIDPLTRVLNRREFRKRTQTEWDRSVRHNCQLACVMLDLDFFKRVNDVHGHAAGDVTLSAIAGLLRDGCRASDLVSRYGGEEFCVLLPETDEAGAMIWAERLRIAVEEIAIPVPSGVLGVTASMGVAERLEDTDGPDAMIEMADQALAVAKRSGRNRVVRFSCLDPMPVLLEEDQAADPLHATLARDAMSPAIFCPREHDTLRHVTEVMLQLRINSAPVIDQDGRVTGILTESDVLTRTADGAGWDLTVREAMEQTVVCYDESAPLEQVYQFLARSSIPRVVVVQEQCPVGVISRATLLRWFHNWTRTQGNANGNGEDSRKVSRAESRAGILETAQVIADRVEEMKRHLASTDEDFVPCVVGEATRLQSLVNDLLGYC